MRDIPNENRVAVNNGSNHRRQGRRHTLRPSRTTATGLQFLGMDIRKRKFRNIAHINDLHLANSVIKFTPIVAQGVDEAQSLPKRHEFGTSRTFKVGLWRSDVRAFDSLGDDKLWHPITSRLDILGILRFTAAQENKRDSVSWFGTSRTCPAHILSLRL